MSLRIRTPSLFRPPPALVADFNRRGVLLGALTLGALPLLTGCDVSENDSVQNALRTVSSWNDGAQAAIFRPEHLAPTFSPSQVVKPPRFNAYYDIEHVKPVDGATWKLELAGLIKDKRPWTLPQIYQLPEQELIIRQYLRGGLGLHRAVVRPELARLPHPNWRRSDGQIRLCHLQ